MDFKLIYITLKLFFIFYNPTNETTPVKSLLCKLLTL